MNSVIVSVPGKVHLMGEHAVVYGKPALLASINKRMTVSITDGQQLIIESDDDLYVRQIVDLVLKKYTINKPPGMRITITSEIPSGYHLGSSAATAVGVAGALLYFLKKIWNPQVINQLAYEAEKIKHGTPSGSDNTAVTMGGLVWYRKETEFLRSIWQLPFGISDSLNHFYLIDTGKPQETTGEMVMYVRSKFQVQSSKFQKIFDENEVQTKRLITAIKNSDENELIDAMRIGERTLEKMGVVSRKAGSIVRSIERAGGAAKILGGGGRKDAVGYLLCYHSGAMNLENARQITLGGDGVRLEHHEYT